MGINCFQFFGNAVKEVDEYTFVNIHLDPTGCQNE